MYGKMNYAFDAETGEIIVKDNKKTVIKQLENNKKKKRKKKPDFLTQLTKNIDDLNNEFDKNFIIQSLKFARLNLLEYIKNSLYRVALLTKDNEIDGLYLSNFLMIKFLYDRKSINLTILKTEKDYLVDLQTKIAKYQKEDLDQLISHILSYIEFYFKDLL